MMAVPTTEMLYVSVPAFGLSKQSLLKFSVGKKLNRRSLRIWAAGQEVRYNDPIIPIPSSTLWIQIDVTNILPAFFACRIALQFVYDVFRDVTVKNDLAVR